MKKSIKFLLLKFPSYRIFDKIIAIIFFIVAHKRLPKKNSDLFNDYLFFLKTSTEIDWVLRQLVSDKSLVKIFYRGIFCEDVFPKTLLISNSFDQFLSSNLPDKCIIKPAHLSGCVYFDKTKGLSHVELNQIKSWYVTNIYYDISRERNYKELKPTVICEEIIIDKELVRDYKIFCFNGKPGAIQVDVGRHSTHTRRLYTINWEPLAYWYNYPLAPIDERPALLDEALKMASKISSYFSFIRVDCYITENKVYLGELTSVPENAHGRFESTACEKHFMSLLQNAPLNC